MTAINPCTDAERRIPIDTCDRHKESRYLAPKRFFVYTLLEIDAALWARVLDNIEVRSDIEIYGGGDIAWALRPGTPHLLASLDDFMKNHRQGTFTGNMLFRRYYEETQWIQNPLASRTEEKFESLRVLFRKYAGAYHIDWLKAMALAYQESRLDQNARSHRAALGIMQLLPSTAAGSTIGIPDIDSLENNIHAGIKYLAYLRDTYFDDAEILPEHRIDFAIAAYNAGPARINRMRARAGRMGLDPNRWFSNVEVAARQSIGREPVRYVSNIYIYYVAYKSAFQVIQHKPEAETTSPPPTETFCAHPIYDAPTGFSR